MNKQFLIDKLKNLDGLSREERLYLIKLIVERKNLTDRLETEIQNIESIIGKAQKNLQSGLEQLNIIKDKRTNTLKRTIRRLDSVNDAEARVILPDLNNTEMTYNDNEE